MSDLTAHLAPVDLARFSREVAPGEEKLLGSPLIIGLAISFGGPIWMTRRWKRRDGR